MTSCAHWEHLRFVFLTVLDPFSFVYLPLHKQHGHITNIRVLNFVLGVFLWYSLRHKDQIETMVKKTIGQDTYMGRTKQMDGTTVKKTAGSGPYMGRTEQIEYTTVKNIVGKDTYMGRTKQIGDTTEKRVRGTENTLYFFFND